MESKNFGKKMEELAAQYLEVFRGWRILARQVRFREGEIDLVAEAPAEGAGPVSLYFVEVKARRSTRFGGVVESVTTQKMLRMRRAVTRWRQSTGNRRPGVLYFLGIFVDERGECTIEEYVLE